jgi:antirestriction protein ArdC
MTAAAVANEALMRASTGQSGANYGAIFHGFIDKGIAESEIRPRENVFTFHAWRALGRTVRKGEHGVRVSTWVPVQARVDAATGEVRPGGKRPKLAVVFHVSQTDPLNGAVQS